MDEKWKGKVNDTQINYSLSHLPDKILLRLTIKRIFVCKCVCKTWYDLVSDPYFAKLHFNQAQVYHLLRSLDDPILSRMLYLVQPEHDDFERKLEMSYDSSPIKIQLDCNLKLPQLNIQNILDKEEVMSKNCLELSKYWIVNSCNGLLCLSDPADNDPVIVCNPVTGEFINLPQVRTISDYPGMPIIDCGFGFSAAINQYKVIRFFRRGIEQNIVTEVHTLGTQTWRVLRSLPKSPRMSIPTYLNGCIYWFSLSYSVTSFDIEKECFESISTPPLDLIKDIDVSMGVSGGELVMSSYEYYQNNVRFWAMKDNGATKSWSQIFSFNNERLPCDSYEPIKYLNNGELLMFNSYKNALICMDTIKTRFRYFKVRGLGSKVEAIAHIPSLDPLKHALSGHTMKVLRVKSRCPEFQLPEEGQCISIVEVDTDTKFHSEDMDQI